MYYRLRAQLSDGTFAILAHRFIDSSISVYLPRKSNQVYLDIIQNKRVGSNDYTVFTLIPHQLYITDQSYITMNQFNNQIKRIENDLDPNFDFLDSSVVLQQSL